MTRGVTTTVAGLLMTGCALVVGLGAAVPGRRDVIFYEQLRSSQWVWYWPAWFWAVTAGLAVAGIVIAVRPAARRPAAAAAVVLGAQITGRAVVAVRDWFNIDGADVVTLAQNELATRVVIAAAMAMAGLVATCVAVALLWREPERGWAAWRPRRPALLVVGVAVALALPVRMLVADGDIMGAGSVALSGSLPWGGALAAAAWLGPRARRSVVATVGGCAVVMAVGLAVSLSPPAACTEQKPHPGWMRHGPSLAEWGERWVDRALQQPADMCRRRPV